MPIQFGQQPKPVTRYARPAKGNGNQHLRLYETQPKGLPHPWLFVHRENAKAAVHALTIVEDEQGEQFVHLLITKRPPLGGQLSIELPAGLCGDQDANEKAEDALKREVQEETGYRPEKAQMLAPNLFNTSAGLTTEKKAFGIAQVKGKPQAKDFDASEHAVLVGELNVPLTTFSDYGRFINWLKDMDQAGYAIGMDVIAARGLMPPVQSGGKLDISA